MYFKFIKTLFQNGYTIFIQILKYIVTFLFNKFMEVLKFFKNLFKKQIIYLDKYLQHITKDYSSYYSKNYYKQVNMNNQVENGFEQII